MPYYNIAINTTRVFASTADEAVKKVAQAVVTSDGSHNFVIDIHVAYKPVASK